VGDNCIFAGQSASSGHLTVGDGSVVYGQAGLPGDLPPRSIVGGSPAVDSRLWMKFTAALNRLPDLQKRVRELEAEVERLKA
jgi:UDP-3-O-[3-hydroxymyristoyl] glucosamine N-acyltransferase